MPDSGTLRSPVLCASPHRTWNSVCGGPGCTRNTSTPSLPMALQEDRDTVEETVRAGLKSAPSVWYWTWIPGDISPPGKTEGLRQSCTHLHLISTRLPRGWKHRDGDSDSGREAIPRPTSGVCGLQHRWRGGGPHQERACPGRHGNQQPLQPWSAGLSNVSLSSCRSADCVKGFISPPRSM